MMIPALSRKWLVRALGVMLGVVIVMGCAGTIARADDDDDDLADVKFFRSLLQGLGLQRGDTGINYRERSPLVVPPSRNLPPPATGPIVEKNPAWPKDPDIKARKEAKAERAAPRKYGDNVMESIRPLRPDELRPSGKPGRNAGTNSADNRVTDYSAPMKPSELGYKGGVFSSLFKFNNEGEYGTFTGEAPRTSLIEPPAGYRTPSPTQPYGTGKEKWDPTPTDRLLLVR